jgi:type II secretory pathway pseudopilin PulG
MNYNIEIKKVQGQVAIVVLLISAVVLTLGLSVAKKTVVDVRVESDQEQLKQAFNAAESGIDKYIATSNPNYVATDSQSSAKVESKSIGGGDQLNMINFNKITLVNNNLIFWLVGHNLDGTINYSDKYSGSVPTLCVKDGFAGALKVDYFYLDGGVYKVKRYGYNINSVDFVTGYTNLSLNRSVCDLNYKDLALAVPVSTGTPLLLSVKPLGSGAQMYLLGSSIFPEQGFELTSTGRVGDVSTGVSRSLKVARVYKVPGFALDAITSFGSVTP